MAAPAGAVPRPGDDSSPITQVRGYRSRRSRPKDVLTSAARSHRRGGMDHPNPTTGPSATFRTALCAVFACAALVVAYAVVAPSGRPTGPATFVDRALGSPSPDASLVRRTPGGSALAVDGQGLTAHVGNATVRLGSRSAGSGSWQRHASGVTRSTSFGSESILFGINRAEQFLTVERRQGTRTWSWQLDATHGTPDDRPERRRGLRAQRSARRLPHPPGRDPRPKRPRHHASRRALVARASAHRLDARPAARRQDAAGAVPDRPDRTDRRVRAPGRPGRHDELYRRQVDGLVEPRHHKTLGGGQRRCAGRAADRALDRRDRAAGRLEHRSGRRRRTRPGRSSRPSSGTASTARSRRRSRSRGRAATPTRRAGSSRTRASIRSSASTRAEAPRPRCRAGAPPRRATRPASP